MSSLVPIGVLAETTLPNIATKVASEPIDASQTRMTKEEEMKVCIYPKEEICNIINAILQTPNCNCSLCYRHLRQANCLQLTLKMSSLDPIEVLAETTLPNIATKVASEPIDASQTSMTKEKDVKVRITKTTNL